MNETLAVLRGLHDRLEDYRDDLREERKAGFEYGNDEYARRKDDQARGVSHAMIEIRHEMDNIRFAEETDEE